jgi:hypothetical protein
MTDDDDRIQDDYEAQLNRRFSVSLSCGCNQPDAPNKPQESANYVIFLQVRPLLKHDAVDGRRHFFVDHVFCIFKKELMKYVVLECVHVSLLHYIILYLCIHSVFDQIIIYIKIK